MKHFARDRVILEKLTLIDLLLCYANNSAVYPSMEKHSDPL